MRTAKVLPGGNTVQRIYGTCVKAFAAAGNTYVFRGRIAFHFKIGKQSTQVHPVAKQTVHEKRVFAHAADTGQYGCVFHGKYALPVKALGLPMIVRTVAGNGHAFCAECFDLLAGP
jgi:hypothetical protein